MRLFCLLFVCALFTVSAQARDDKYLYDIALAIQADGGNEPLDDKVQFYFGTQAHPEVAKVVREFQAKQVSNAINRSDNEACRIAFMGALRKLRDDALDMGADAVINIHSFQDKKPMVDNEKYECHAGNVVAGVVLRGTVVRLK